MKKHQILKSSVKETVSSKPFRLRLILIATAILCLILSLFSFFSSVSLKRRELDAIGERAIDTGRGIAISLRTFQPDKLQELINNPQQNDSYRVLSSYLSEVKTANNYKYLYLISKNNSGYLYLADADFSENPSHISGKDYFSIGTPFNSKDFGKSTSSLLFGIYNKTTPYGYTRSIINHKDRGAFTLAFIPVANNAGEIICTLAIANKVDTVLAENFLIRSLNVIAFVLLAIFLISALWVTFLLARDRKQNTKTAAQLPEHSDALPPVNGE